MKKGKNTKKEKLFREILVLIGILLFAYMFQMMINSISYKSKKYEYYTSDGQHGTATECGTMVVGRESCLVGNMYIEVSQYSEVK